MSILNRELSEKELLGLVLGAIVTMMAITGFLIVITGPT